MLTRSVRCSAPMYSILGIRVEHAATGIDRETEFGGDALPLGIGGPSAVPDPRGLAPSCDGALELGIEAYAPNGCALLEEAPVFLSAGPVDSGVVRCLGAPCASRTDPQSGIEPSADGQLARDHCARPGGGQDLAPVAVRSRGGGLGDETLPDPGVHSSAGGVGVAAEVSLGQITERDGAVDAHIGQRPRAPVAERPPLATVSRIILAPVAFPHAAGCVFLTVEGGARDRADGSVHHIRPSVRSRQ